jgi:WD40 repeat protein
VVRIFGDLRFRIDGPLLALAIGADGRIWSVEEPGLLRHWDPATGLTLQKILLSDTDLVWQFSAGARLLASGSDELTLWDVATGEVIATLGQPAWVDALAFRADGQILAVGSDDGVVRLWDVPKRSLLAELAQHDSSVSAVAFSPDGQTIAAAAEDKSICLWDTAKGRFKGRLIGHSDRIQALAWHPAGKLLVSGGWDTTARVWDVSAAETKMLLNGHAECVTAMAFSPDGQVLACADSEFHIWLWDHAHCFATQTLEGHAGEVSSLAFSPDGRRLLSGGQDRRLILWDVAKAQNLSPRADATSEIGRVALSPDSQSIAYVNGSTALRIWDALSGEVAFEVKHSSELFAVTFSPDGQWLATGDLRGQIQLWSPKEKRLLRTLDMHRHGVTSLAFSHDSRQLASAGGTDGYVYLWSLNTFEPVLLIPIATENCTVETVAFVPGTTQVVAAGVEWLTTRSSEGVVCLWDYAQPAKLATLSVGTNRLAVHPDGRQLATATLHDSACLWDLPTRTLSAELIGHSALVTALAYDRKGQLLATGGDDGTMRLWDTETGDGLGSTELDSPIRDLAFSTDGRWIASAHANATCALLDVATLLRR